MNESMTPSSEEVVISVERLIRFCYIAKIMYEQGQQYDPRQSGLPQELTRWGTLMFVTGSFLYSLFDHRSDSTNLVRIWSGFEHPFTEELQVIDSDLNPLRADLRNVRNSYGFHGSLSRVDEAPGLSIFEEPRASELRAVIGKVLSLAGRMIPWHMEQVGQHCLIPAFTAQFVGFEEHS